jgi:metal-responsive CopG/Arc/MetJ family transcriptional regulator
MTSTKYKDANDRKVSLSVSLTLNLISELDTIAAELELDRSKLVAALINLVIKNKENKSFNKEVLNCVNT